MNWTAEEAFGGSRKTGKQTNFPVSKYNAKRCIINGITFASQKEGKRYQELLLLEKCGAIQRLSIQPMFLLQGIFYANGETHRAIYYRADFQYWDKAGQWTVEDVKGYRTDIYRLKKKLFLYLHQDVKFIES